MTGSNDIEINPFVLCPHPSGVHCFAATECLRWVFTGGQDGLIRKYDFFQSMNGKSKLTQSQMHSMPDGVWRAGVLLGSWENEEGAEEDNVGVDDQGLVSNALVNPVDIFGAGNHKTPGAGGAKASFETPASTKKDKSGPVISQVYSLAVQKQALWGLSGLQNGDINLWSVRHDQGTLVHALRGHNAEVSLLKLSNDETKCYSGSFDKSINLWDLNTGQVLSKFNGHSSAIISQFNLTHDTFIATDFAGISILWDCRDPSLKCRVFDPSSYDIPYWCLSSCAHDNLKSFFCGRRNELGKLLFLVLNCSR